MESSQTQKKNRSKKESTAMTQLTADILQVMAQGENSVSMMTTDDAQCEVIRNVLYELPSFHAFDLFQALRTFGPAKQKEVQKHKQMKVLNEEKEAAAKAGD